MYPCRLADRRSYGEEQIISAGKVVIPVSEKPSRSPFQLCRFIISEKLPTFECLRTFQRRRAVVQPDSLHVRLAVGSPRRSPRRRRGGFLRIRVGRPSLTRDRHRRQRPNGDYEGQGTQARETSTAHVTSVQSFHVRFPYLNSGGSSHAQKL